MNKIKLIKNLLFITVIGSGVLGMPFYNAGAESQGERTSKKLPLRSVSQSKQLSIADFVNDLGLKNGQDYVLVKGDPENCLDGKLVVREVDDGTLSITLGDRVLVYNVASGSLISDNSERDCKIIVRTNYRNSTINFHETYDCGEQKYEIRKTVEFATLKGKSVLSYQLASKDSVQDATTSSASLPPMLCRLEAN